MPSTTTDPVIEKQKLIQARRIQTAARYPDLWTCIASEWNSPGPDDRAWLMYAANYLFRTAGVRWAMDPLMLPTRVPEAPYLDVAGDFQNLSFVILTHSHTDHLDLNLLQTLKDLPVRFIIPEFLLPLVMKPTGILEEKIIIPIPLHPFEMNGILITPFSGLHWENDSSRPNGLRGVPAMGYLIEFSGKRWLFPGDTRVYDSRQIPDFGPVDGLFAHLWLGRTGAMTEPPPLLESFCRFFLDLKPRRIVLSHLHELSRGPLSYWDESHAMLATKTLQKISPGVHIASANMGESIQL